jgi:hypothetical protein
VLEIAPADAMLIHCCASPDALEHLVVEAPSISGVIAAGEALIVAPPQQAGSAVSAAEDALAGDPDHLVIDLTDAYEGFRLAGDYRAALARCADWPLADTALVSQGLFAQLAAKVVQCDGYLYVFVGSHVSHHLEQRLRHACADLVVSFAPTVAFGGTGAES